MKIVQSLSNTIGCVRLFRRRDAEEKEVKS
jgi:hypothetical protein